MLTRITIENFKGVREPVVVELRPLTLLFGANSAGKSTILHALHFAYELLLRGNANPSATARGGSGLDLGGFLNLVHGRDPSRAIRMRFDFAVEGDLLEYIEPGSEAFDEGAESQANYPLGRPPMDDVRMAGSLTATALHARAQAILPGSGLWQRQGTAVSRIPRYLPPPSIFPAIVADATRKTTRAAIEFVVRWSAVRRSPVVERYRVRINRKPLGTIEASGDGRDARVTKLNLEHPILHDQQNLSEEFSSPLADVLDWTQLFHGGGIAVRETLGALPTGPLRTRFDNPEVEVDDWPGLERLLRLLFVGPLEVLREILEGFRYVGPLRAIPPRGYEPPATHDEGRWSNGLAAWDAVLVDEQLRREASRWMHDANRLGSGYRFGTRERTELQHAVTLAAALAVQSQPRVDKENSAPRGDAKTRQMPAQLLEQVRKNLDGRALHTSLVLLTSGSSGSKRSTITLQPHDVGVGISQVVPVLVAALSRRAIATDGRPVPVSLVAFEQPELHVHPAMQVVLGDLFIKTSKTKQLLIETHSEHIVLRLLRRIRETTEDELPEGAPAFSPRELNVLYVEPGDDGLQVRLLRIDKTGEFVDRWPKGFFEERAKELF